MLRELNPCEVRCLTPVQQAYLIKHPSIVCLEAGSFPPEALYLTPRHGAVTIDRAIELDQLHDNYLAKQSGQCSSDVNFNPAWRISDEMAMRHERCIDEHGCGLF